SDLFVLPIDSKDGQRWLTNLCLTPVSGSHNPGQTFPHAAKGGKKPTLRTQNAAFRAVKSINSANCSRRNLCRAYKSGWPRVGERQERGNSALALTRPALRSSPGQEIARRLGASFHRAQMRGLPQCLLLCRSQQIPNRKAPPAAPCEPRTSAPE